MHKCLIRSIPLLAVLLLISSCGSSTGNLQISETDNQTVAVDETVHLNNCGGKANSSQTATRSFATNFEGAATLKLSYQIVQGSIEARYGQYRNISKSQELIAPPHTNMEFVLRWAEQQRLGTVSVDGQIGTYKVEVPVSVELLSSKDLGCDLTIPPTVTSTIVPQKLQAIFWVKMVAVMLENSVKAA